MTAPASTNVRQFEISASSAPVFGRVLCTARNHHFVIDGPVYNGCPGEALTPPEIFLTAVASCGVELIHVIARDEKLPVEHVAIQVQGVVDRDNQPRTDVTVFTLVHLRCTLRGVTQEQAVGLVSGFRRRCPIFGTVSVAAVKVVVDVDVA